MPANKGPIFGSTAKEKPVNGGGFGASGNKKKKQRVCVKSKKHCRQYLLHSEYRSTYTWHEYTGPHQEHTIVRRAPQAQPTSTKQPSAKLQSAKSTEDDNTEGPTLEPPLPRRKKNPELAYRHHEFITAADGGGIDAVDTNVVADKVREVTGSSALPPSQLSKAISRISTEYRLQFAWPRRAQLTNGETVAPIPAAGGAGGLPGGPRKSMSMGTLKQGIAPTEPAPVHMRKRPGDVDHKRDGIQASELEPLFGNNADHIDGVMPDVDEKDEDLTDFKISFRSVTKEEKEKENTRKVAPVMNTMPPAGRPSSVQARPISGILQEADNERAMARARKDFLIRHHLDRTTGVGDGALLPSPTREKLEPVAPRRRDEAKDEIQPRTKSSPKNSPRTGRSQSLGPISRSPKRQTPRAPSVSKDAKEKEKEHKDKEGKDRSGEPERHPRPTGVSAVGGRVRWSIRESSQTPVKSSTSEPPIPPLPPPPSGPGPTQLHKKPSPRSRRKPFLATTASPNRPLHHHAKPTSANVTKVPGKNTTQHSVDANTTVSSSVSSGNEAAASGSRSQRTLKLNNENNRARGSARAQVTTIDPSKSSSDNRYQSYRANAALQAMTAEPQVNGDGTGGDSSIASTPPSQSATAPVATAVVTSCPWFDDEPVVKSPPEPTRVKSPEQMIMRSPEPVNWTVPLDTGKTFTVTQNVREGEPLTRPHSEAKTWAAGSTVISTPQSAPPELAQHKSHHQSQHSGCKSPESESVSLGSYTGLNGHKDLDSERDSPLPNNLQGTSTTSQSDKGSVVPETKEKLPEEPSIKPVAGTNLRCLEDPVFEFDRGQKTTEPVVPTTTAPVTQSGYRVLEAEDPVVPAGGVGSTSSAGYHVLEAPVLSPGAQQRSVTSDVLEIARNRFDKFWGKGGPENQA
ncbi:flocculation protein FLO11 isoform X8 [Fopius arisanus]|uniref:Nuclear protein MDM1 n=1 Tax=Fopius arisanus TaxID=64838 RepID=A0A9R1SW97_9HYME|nr:PREDICTED: flocculation protein FLO11 isoform X8 [Fopius arisanus]